MVFLHYGHYLPSDRSRRVRSYLHDNLPVGDWGSRGATQ
jgi:hypothetical protein